MLYFAAFTIGFCLGTMLALWVMERRRPTT